MTKKNRAKINAIDGNRNPEALRRIAMKKVRQEKYLKGVKKEAATLGVPFTRLVDKRKPNFGDLSRPNQ